MKEEESPGLARYLSVVEGKTAWLISTAVVSALEALQKDRDFCDRVESAALNAGILFQIQDDLLDIYGEKQRDRRATDIAEGKVSALIALFNDLANSGDREEMAGILRTPRAETSDQQIQQALSLLERYRVKEATLEKIREIQRSVIQDPELMKHPEIHQLLIAMNEQFLEPVRHLL
jgi:geranylgeranyl pyrophosphate synthase